MERKVGEVFEHEGEIYKVYQEVHGCAGCCFSHLNLCLDLKPIRGYCAETQRKDCRGVIFVKIKDMETRNIKLSLEKAKEFYAKGGEFKDLALSAFTEEELTKKELPKTWGEYTRRPQGALYYINIGLMTLQDSVAHDALSQLHHLRECYRQGWKPDYTDREVKYSIIWAYNDIHVHTTVEESNFLTFQSFKIADEFLNNFRDLIKQAGDLI